MAKTKNKEHKGELYYLKSKNRELEKQVRQLQKELKHYTKKDHLYEDTRLELQEALSSHEDETNTDKSSSTHQDSILCERCNEGRIENIRELLDDKWYGNCNHCGYSKRVK